MRHKLQSIATMIAAASTMLLPANFCWALSAEKVIYTFTGSDGRAPQSGLVFDANGNLYGTTVGGGTSTYCQCGTVFELTPTSDGKWTEKVLYSFSAGNTDGSGPFSGVAFDSKGNLYGTTTNGGTFGPGTVFELTPNANGSWSEKILYSFSGGVDGGAPYATTLTIDQAGNLYGTTIGGGVYGFGVVFELIAGENGTWTQKVLHSFVGAADGANSYSSALIFDRTGDLYGVAQSGGANDYGVVFELIPGSNGTWSERVVYSFTGTGGESAPSGGVLLDGAGNLFGVAFDVFELTPGWDGAPIKKTIHTFFGPPDGAYPQSALVRDSAGNLYGTTGQGGDHHGTIFELSAGANGSWNERVLHRFSADGVDGVSPYAPLAIDANGNLFGTTQTGGASNAGVVFEVTP